MVSMHSTKILAQFDKAAKFYLPRINEAKVYVARTRLTALRGNSGEWGLVAEEFGYATRGIGDYRFPNKIFVVGSRPVAKRLFDGPVESLSDGLCSAHHIFPLRSYSERSLSDSESLGYVPVSDPMVFYLNDILYVMASAELKKGRRPSGTTIVDQRLQKRGTRMVIDASVFARAVAAYAGDAVFLPDHKIVSACGGEVEIFLRANAWEHPDIFDDEKPSDFITFSSLAKALASGNPLDFSPGKAPNSDWKHWDDEKL
jgi:hypothetical protein